MGTDTEWSTELFRGLKALAESAFPKRCANCGRIFETAEQFLRETRGVDKIRSGLKQSYDDDDNSIVEVFRNCPCGSTLMDFFSDRRDLSEVGLRRRQRFGELMEHLIGAGLDKQIARAELLKVLRGDSSEIINNLKRAAKG